METNHQVHNLIILDESGSMNPIRNAIIRAFNEIVQTVKGIEKQFPEQEHLISFVTFNSLGTNVLHFNEPVAKLEPIDKSQYVPDATTPLFDAMGFSFEKLRQVLENKTEYNVLVTILTDGEENASKKFTSSEIKKTIEELKLNRWTFTYIGTEHAVEKFAASISITNVVNFYKNEDDINNWVLKESKSRTNYSARIRMKMEAGEDYYEDDEI
jgi:hypothetical protein